MLFKISFLNFFEKKSYFIIFRYRSEKEKKRLDEAGVNEAVINSAISEFILEIIVKHGKPAERLCNKGI